MRTICVVALVLATGFVWVSFRSPARAVADGLPIPAGAGEYENYDIRSDRSPTSIEILERMRGGNQIASWPAAGSASLKLEFNQELGVVETISAVDGSRPQFTPPSEHRRADVLLRFVADNPSLFGIAPNRLEFLQKTADYTNPDRDLSFVHFRQEIGSIPLFGAEIRAAFDRRNQIVRIVNSLARDIGDENIPGDFGEPESAVIAAAKYIGVDLSGSQLLRSSRSKSEARFSSDRFTDEITAEKFYFHVGGGVLAPAWRVLFWTNGPAYYVVTDTEGRLLWRKNITESQTLPATYGIYASGSSPVLAADSPAPFTPGPNGPFGTQAPIIPRTTLTFIGNEPPNNFNDLGWIPDGGLPVRTPANPNITDGNNVEAGIDRQSPTGVDVDGWGFGNPARVFDHTYNPRPGNPPPGDDPLPTTQTYPGSPFQQGSSTHAFYLANRWHDVMYRFGFTESAGNFQHFNFGRGGSEGDRLSVEIQDGSGTNGANFSTPADGGRGRLQMFIWTATTPDTDGALDSQMFLHEITHGLTSRLHGNATGLFGNMARGMGEGWSDFFAVALLSEPTDDPLGIHAVAGYTTLSITPGYMNNYYYGLRRFPIAVRASIGPNGLPHNPLTFRYINSDCLTVIGTTTTAATSAYPRGPIGVATCDQIHNIGELWAVTLWEVRGQLIQRHGPVEGNRRTLKYVTDGMKLSPINPTILQARDAIMIAASASDPADLRYVWRGFAIRGMGLSASIQNVGGGSNNTVVTDATDLPVQFRRTARTDFDGDRKADISVFRPSDRIWYLEQSNAGFVAINWGLAADIPVASDLDGDGKSDVAVFRATTDGNQPDFYILNSSDSTVTFVSWGVPGDIPVHGDFDSDDRADIALFRPATGQFWIRKSSDGSVLTTTPLSGTQAFAGDFDGDGRGDLGTFSDGVWRILSSADNFETETTTQWGITSDRPAPADYDGDGKDDIAVYRPSEGTWYIANSAGGYRFTNFGLSSDTPVPDDYDGDGRADIAVFRSGVWYINTSTSGVSIRNFGLSSDVPLPATFIP